MILDILDVEHGAAACAIGDGGEVILFDCGRSSNVSPTTMLAKLPIRHVDELVLSHIDEDHVADLPTLRRTFPVQRLTANRSNSSGLVRLQKMIGGGDVGPGAEAALSMLDSYIAPVLPTRMIAGAAARFALTHYHNTPPEFFDTNNLSLVSFLSFGDVKVVLPGDLEAAGWRGLLRNPTFCHELSNVNVFVASHHGRENGYCADVFDHCRPQIVILSDCDRRFETQEHDLYSRHATGVRFDDGSFRRVLTTRCDGSIRLQHCDATGSRIQVHVDPLAGIQFS